MAFNNPLVGGEGGELIRDSIKSPDFVTGVSGWIIRRDGSAEFNNVDIRLDLTTGSITVGPDTGPQVTIEVGPDGGRVQFPVNRPYSNDANPPEIYGDFTDGTEQVILSLVSGFTDSNAGSANLDLISTEEDTDANAGVILGAYGGTSYSDLYMTDNYVYFDTPEFQVANEVIVSTDNPDDNFPIRVIAGRVNAGTNTVTLTGADAEITNTASTNAYLVNGVAYSVDVQIQTRQSVGTSAAGTQRFDWKLWETTVGTTQLDNTIETWNKSVGNNLATEQFSFLFNYAGTTGSYTLRLSCADGGGADTLQVQSNTRYFMIVKRLGDPAKILGL